MDPDRMLMANALPPGNQLFKDKSKVRRAIEEAGIPHTYVSGNCYAAYFLGGLGQIAMGHVPPRQHVTLYGDGNVKGRKPTPLAKSKLQCHLLLFLLYLIKTLFFF